VKGDLEEQDIHQHLGLVTDISLFGKVSEIDQGHEIVIEITIREPLAKTESDPKIDPPADPWESVFNVFLTGSSIVGKNPIRIQLAG